LAAQGQSAPELEHRDGPFGLIDWHWIFWINVPIGLAAILLSSRLLPGSRGASERLDLIGVSLVTTGVVALVWALTCANTVGWISAETLGTLLVGCLLLVAFVWWERRVAEPMVPLRLFANREFAIGNLTSYLMSGATFAAAFFITQELQLARGYTPLGTGLRLLPFFGPRWSSRRSPVRSLTGSDAGR